ncbi:hypothetical protein QUF54_03855 [Candidatus Marithioploca araucensis]|uniref:Uncharacterized protein n=1 Tax=Candidatus Marithioploca araucensis TaxID=70273 RepID=A0ABT7VSP4_9GAMM|nr:hypothetical protein [Candidatus Marithioploca araucensis]
METFKVFDRFCTVSNRETLYKEQVIELLQRVCTVSVGTMGIFGKMP